MSQGHPLFTGNAFNDGEGMKKGGWGGVETFTLYILYYRGF